MLSALAPRPRSRSRRSSRPLAHPGEAHRARRKIDVRAENPTGNSRAGRCRRRRSTCRNPSALDGVVTAGRRRMVSSPPPPTSLSLPSRPRRCRDCRRPSSCRRRPCRCMIDEAQVCRSRRYRRRRPCRPRDRRRSRPRDGHDRSRCRAEGAVQRIVPKAPVEKIVTAAALSESSLNRR